MTVMGLPALWLDDFVTSAAVGLLLANAYPEDGDTEYAADGTLTLEVLSTAPSGVDLSATTIYIDGVAALLNGVFQAGYITGSFATNINVHDYRFVVGHDADFASEATVTVRVVSATVDTLYALDETYTFTVEDLIEPKLVSVIATASNVVRVVFDEGMLALSDSGLNDALNPANYVFAFVPDHDRQAAVWVVAESVAQVSSTTYDVTTDLELTFWKTYRLTCGDIADDSLNANELDDDYRTDTFASWTPPDWPTNRRFNLWDMLSGGNRKDDIHGDAERLCSMWQDILDYRLWETDKFSYLWDTDRAPEIALDAKLQDLGNPHRLVMTELQKRKLLDILVESYGQHGTEDAIINMVRFFLGIDVTVYSYNDLDYRWVLGTDILGIGTRLGPTAGTAAPYTFVVQSLLDLTTEERNLITRIARTVKVAHEHIEVKDPSDSPTFDHWQLGHSVLGLETSLH